MKKNFGLLGYKYKCYLCMVLVIELLLLLLGEDGLVLVWLGVGWSLCSVVVFLGLDLLIMFNRFDRYWILLLYVGFLLVLWNEKYLFYGVDNLIYFKVGKWEYWFFSVLFCDFGCLF